MVSTDWDGHADAAAVLQSRSDPVTAGEVADELGCSPAEAADRLERLRDRGELAAKTVGDDVRVWWARGGEDTGEYTETDESDPDATDQDQLFRSLVEATEEYAIFMLDPDGYVVSWNRGAERIKGYDRETIIGQHFSTFYTDEDAAAGVPGENLTAAAKRGYVEDEGLRVRADGTLFWANVTITAVRRDDGSLRGFAKVTRDMTDRREWERELERERDLLERVLDAVPVSVGIVDADGAFVRTNERAQRRLGMDGSACGRSEVSDHDVYDEDGQQVPPADLPHARAFERGESVEDWTCQVDLPDVGRRWLSMDAEPLFDDDGSVEKVVVAADDVTQVKEQARQLQRERDELASELDDVFRRVTDGFYAVDQDWQFTYLNAQAESWLGCDESAVLGESLWEAFPNVIDTAVEERYRAAMADQEPVQFEHYYEALEEWFAFDVYPSDSGLSVYFRQVTERKERERELERYERIVDNLPVGVYRNTPGPDGEFVEGNERLAEIFDADSVDEIRDHSVSDLYVDPEERAAFSERLEREGIVEDVELRQETLDGRTIWISITAIRTEEGGETYFDGVVQDITERKERTQELRQYETLFKESRDVNVVVSPDGTLQYVTPSSEHVLGYDPNDLAGRDAFEYIHPEDRPAVLEEWAKLVDDRDFAPAVEFRFRHDDGSWVWLEARGRNLLAAPHIEGLVVYTRDVTERREREETLERQREQLAALDNLNGVFRDISEAVVQQSTREEIERTVCERLADSESYLFAWTCEVDPRDDSVEPRVEAGVDGYVEDVALSVDEDDPHGRGPTGTAIRTKEVQVTHDAQRDPAYEPWHEKAAAYGFRSTAAVPVVHEDSIYGVVNVYTDRVEAFTGQEREVVSQLGEVVGHAIAATERKRALMGDELVEVTFRIEDVLGELGVDGSADGTVTFDEAVPIGDGEFLEYGTASEEGVELLESLTERLPHFSEFTVIESGFEEDRFEVRLSEPPVVAAVAARGGSVDRARIENGDYQMTVHLPPVVDVRDIIDHVQDTYPAAEMVTRRQISRDDEREGVERAITERLTERQRAALQASFYSGFFEWPRESSGEEVAESLGVSAPTFHQHLRKAQRKVLEALLA